MGRAWTSSITTTALTLHPSSGDRRRVQTSYIIVGLHSTPGLRCLSLHARELSLLLSPRVYSSSLAMESESFKFPGSTQPCRMFPSIMAVSWKCMYKGVTNITITKDMKYIVLMLVKDPAITRSIFSYHILPHILKNTSMVWFRRLTLRYTCKVVTLRWSNLNFNFLFSSTPENSVRNKEKQILAKPPRRKKIFSGRYRRLIS